MTPEMVYGCDGCRTTIGASGCPIHGRRSPAPARIPFRCPVCEGHGRMMPRYPLPSVDPTVECRPCNGTGIVWSESAGAGSEKGAADA